MTVSELARNARVYPIGSYEAVRYPSLFKAISKDCGTLSNTILSPMISMVKLQTVSFGGPCRNAVATFGLLAFSIPPALEPAGEHSRMDFVRSANRSGAS
jgi:hypothetical protein